MRPRLTLLALALCACADELIAWRDPLLLIPDGGGAHGPTTLLVGLGEGSAFVTLADAPRLPIVHGIQGGTWSMPTLRADTLAASLQVACVLTSDADETLGQTEVTTPTRPAGPGWVEVALLPIAVMHAPPRSAEPIDDLEGAPATLSCAASAAGARASADYAVTLDAP